jgi:DDE family transposase
VNLTDPDSRRMKGNRRYIQGYNAQGVVNEPQIVIAAEISTNPADFSHLRSMIETALDELEQAGVTEKPTVAVADAQYWNEQHMDAVTGQHGIQVLILPGSGKREGERPGWTGGRSRSCDASSRPTLGARHTENAKCQSSLSTVTPNTTARSTGSTTAADRSSGRSGG